MFILFISSEEMNEQFKDYLVFISVPGASENINDCIDNVYDSGQVPYIIRSSSDTFGDLVTSACFLVKSPVIPIYYQSPSDEFVKCLIDYFMCEFEYSYIRYLDAKFWLFAVKDLKNDDQYTELSHDPEYWLAYVNAHL